ncbi:hypothetical protein J3Q64DRAFT_1700525 [Phycomyces blakesleeanus]|uniref:Homeobox domain-containing protein n=1 Tax=Phycomyces blakesleeanus TaxID=4837 RepID=A0ABR3AUV9_PHYBL
MSEKPKQFQSNEDPAYDSGNDSWSPKIKNRRRFSATEAALLERRYAEEQSPSQHVLQGLADQMSTPRKTITTWFQNRRAKYKRRSYRNKQAPEKANDSQQKTNDGSPGQRMSDTVSDVETCARSSSSSLLLVERRSPETTASNTNSNSKSTSTLASVSMSMAVPMPTDEGYQTTPLPDAFCEDDRLGDLSHLPSTPSHCFDYNNFLSTGQGAIMYSSSGYNPPEYMYQFQDISGSSLDSNERNQYVLNQNPSLCAWQCYDPRLFVHPDQTACIIDPSFVGCHTRESNTFERICFPGQSDIFTDSVDCTYEWREQVASYLISPEGK